MMKFAWRKDLPDHAGRNWAQVEEVQLGEYTDILEADEIHQENMNVLKCLNTLKIKNLP